MGNRDCNGLARNFSFQDFSLSAFQEWLTKFERALMFETYAAPKKVSMVCEPRFEKIVASLAPR
jgi:hypothetical protein